MKIRAFITHKLAEHFSDCQDRFSINQDTKSVALADGMSQSYQQKIWANLLVCSYTSHPDFVPNKESIKELSVQWQDYVTDQIEQMKNTNGPEYLIIMNENALAMHKSAGATFLGIRFNDSKWEGDVLGDTCLIETENDKIKHIFTSQQGNNFDNHPDYFDSDALKEGKGTPLQISGEITAQTSIILVSDPFSDFLNEKKKEGKEEAYIKELLAVETHEQYEELVARWRNTFGMHNDDSTLIIIEHDGSDDFHYANIDDIEALKTEELKQQATIEQQQEETIEAMVPVEESDSKSQEEPTIEVEPITEEPIATAISEDEFIKMFLDEYHNLARSTSKFGKAKVQIAKDSLIRKTVQAVYRTVNITKK